MSETDWMWVYENPKDAAEKIDRLKKEISEWQPINTAPKDGTMVLLDSKTVPYVGSWRRGHPRDPQEHEICWRAACCGRWTDPTRWMPLPVS